MSYNAVVASVTNIRPIKGADRIVQATVVGENVVINKDIPEGTLGVFFPAEGKLSPAMLAANNLVGYVDPADGVRKGGFFSENGRVRAQKFKGVRSEGYWTPLSSFSWIDPSTPGFLEAQGEGFQFTEVDGHLVAEKYITEATKQAGQQSKGVRMSLASFPKHIDTEQFDVAISQWEAGYIIITEKLEGTSGRYGHVLVPQKRNWFQRQVNKLFPSIWPAEKYQYVIGTRNTILGDGKPDFYGDANFRVNAVKDVQLMPGEIIYFELVGYTSTGALIMPERDNTKVKDKALVKQYGEKMRFTYGAENGETKLYVYRITQVDDLGVNRELSFEEMIKRTYQLNLQVVPVLRYQRYYGTDVDKQELIDVVDMLADGPSIEDGSHIREGVIVRLETADNQTFWAKKKNFTYKVLADIAKDDRDFVDPEESA